MRLQTTSWKLTIESMFPGVDESTVPWTVQSDVPAIAMGVAGALMNGIENFVGEDEEAVADLVLTRFKHGVLLAMNRVSPKSLEAERRLKHWIGTWQERGFSFCASMEATTALAMMNIAVATSLRVTGDVKGERPALSDMRMIDPCAGTGSLPAAALNLGIGSVWASDVRPDFVLRARQNLTQLGYRFRSPQTVTPAGVDGWLPVTRIRSLALERAELRKAKDFEGSDAKLEELKAAGLWVNDKSHHWAHADGRCGELPRKEGDTAQDPAVDTESDNAPHRFFYHDANHDWPEWVSTELSQGIDMLVGNTPWGNKIGNEGDGAEIVQSLARQFKPAGQHFVMCLLVGKPCFAELVLCNEESGVWELQRGAGWESLADWSLLYHAEVGTSRKGCVLIVLVKLEFATSKGKGYQRHNITSYDCSTHGDEEH